MIRRKWLDKYERMEHIPDFSLSLCYHYIKTPRVHSFSISWWDSDKLNLTEYYYYVSILSFLQCGFWYRLQTIGMLIWLKLTTSCKLKKPLWAPGKTWIHLEQVNCTPDKYRHSKAYVSSSFLYSPKFNYQGLRNHLSPINLTPSSALPAACQVQMFS